MSSARDALRAAGLSLARGLRRTGNALDAAAWLLERRCGGDGP